MKVMENYYARDPRPFKVGTQYAYYAPFRIDRDSMGRMRFRVAHRLSNTAWYLVDPKSFRDLKLEVFTTGGAFVKIGMDFGVDGKSFYSNSHYSYGTS